MSHQELQIANGVYITDFRKNGTLVGISEPKNELTNDVGLLIDDCKTIESKCKMLEFSISEIKAQENWQQDSDFKEAVQQNWKVIVRLCGEMKQKILKLFQLKYIPADSKIQQLLDIDRIDTRQANAKHQLCQIQKQGIYL